MTTQTNPLPPLLTDEQMSDEAAARYTSNASACAFMAGARWAETAVREALAAQPGVLAWMHPDGRVIPAATKDTAERDGGATRSSVAGYTIPLVALAARGREVALPEGWVPLRIEYEPGYPEDVAFGPQIMMDRLKKWLDKFFAMRTAPQPAPAGLTDEQIATMRSDAWLVFNASEASQEVRDVIEWYDGTLRAAIAKSQEGSAK